MNKSIGWRRSGRIDEPLTQSSAGRASSLGKVVVAVALALSSAWNAQATPQLGLWTQAQVNTSIQKGVAYLDTQQNLNGSFGGVAPISETGLALVAYGVLANGSFTNLSASYQLHVQNAITWLLGQQDLSGFWADGGFFQTYSTGLALSGLSTFTTVNAAIPAAVTKGRAFLVSEFQGPAFTGCSSSVGPTQTYCGGWNYDNGPGRSDESNTGFAMFGLQLSGGVPAALKSDNINWQHHIQEISTNPFASRNDGGGDYVPGIGGGNFSSNANDTGSMLFGLGYDGVPASDPNVVAGLKLAQDVLGVYELETGVSRNMVYHTGAVEDGSCLIGSLGCDWSFAGGEGGYHYSMFALTKGLGEFIAPSLGDPTNWYAKVVDLLLSEQAVNGSWPVDGRDDASVIFATSLAVSSLGLVAVPTGPTDVFQVKYAANLNIGDSFVDFTNTGAAAGSNLCANVYTFDPAEELISCCTCSITPNGLQSLSVLKSLISNPLTPAIPTAVVIKVVATTGTCNASTVTAANLAHGLLGWSTTLHQNSSAATYSVTETPFSFGVLVPAELAHITSTCGFIQSNGSGFGICKGCAAGGLGAAPSGK